MEPVITQFDVLSLSSWGAEQLVPGSYFFNVAASFRCYNYVFATLCIWGWDGINIISSNRTGWYVWKRIGVMVCKKGHILTASEHLLTAPEDW